MPELTQCPRCNRNNDVRRTTCLYCGEALPLLEGLVQVPALRPVGEWEKGFNVVLAPIDAETATDDKIALLCEVTKLEQDLALAVVAARTSLPVVRVSSAIEAELIVRLLGQGDFGAQVVSDADLALDTGVKRVREIEFGEDVLRVKVLWGDWVSVPRDDVRLVVDGHVVSSSTAVVEAAGKARDGNRDLVESAECFSEDFAIDLYGQGLDGSFRVKAMSFDFNCLGRRPAPSLQANVRELASRLRQYVSTSLYDDDYRRVSRLLEHVWPLPTRVASRGLTYRTEDVRKLTASFVERDGHAQFLRYSRLRFALLGR